MRRACECDLFLPVRKAFWQLFISFMRLILSPFTSTNQQISIISFIVRSWNKHKCEQENTPLTSNSALFAFLPFFLSKQRHKVFNCGIKFKSWWWHNFNVNRKEFDSHSFNCTCKITDKPKFEFIVRVCALHCSVLW